MLEQLMDYHSPQNVWMRRYRPYIMVATGMTMITFAVVGIKALIEEAKVENA